MNKKYKQFIATCEEGHITLFGQAETPDLAFDEFMGNGEFDEYCGIHGIESGEEVEVTAHGVIPFDEADEDMKGVMIDEGWKWITGGYSETRKAIAPQSEE